jgi:DNA-binding NarL/FixJ family response regulator
MKRRRDARRSLEASLETFERLGARLWTERAHAEVGRVSGRPPTGDALTQTERQVAELVASGLTNKAAAARLSVSVKAVEANLTRVYVKLNVNSRTQLAVLLSNADPASAPHVPKSAQARRFEW